MAQTLPAPILWAQRKDKLFLTIDLPEIQNPKVELTEQKFIFEGTSRNKQYRAELEFYADVKTEDAKQAFHGKQATFVIMKKESGPFWPRLLKQTGKWPWLKTDFDKWVDEDEASDDDGLPSGFDFESFKGGDYSGSDSDSESGSDDGDDAGANDTESAPAADATNGAASDATPAADSSETKTEEPMQTESTQ